MKQKGLWRTSVFDAGSEMPLDLEIGVGNGFFFEHLCKSNPDRNILGIELKYKPMIQTIRRALRAGCENARVIRYDASEIADLFAAGELNNVYIFFPDPWPKKRHHKNRLLTYEFFMTLFELQRPGATVQIKTDSAEYFEWILERVPKTPYVNEAQTDNLHGSSLAIENFLTHFEKLWTGKGLKTHYLRLKKPS
ncbi:MAG TPA: tRNA (guanosine(46)-N7)-methyltransferase TrmB [Bdellovibrionales bacterium]|nr:tRNA (guanosine(46)-N7)-methyltransferase TrmB [Bdellovibrionales bacterium]